MASSIGVTPSPQPNLTLANQHIQSLKQIIKSPWGCPKPKGEMNGKSSYPNESHIVPSVSTGAMTDSC